MYKSYTAADYRKYLKLPDDYRVDGFIDYGTGLHKKFTIEQLEQSFSKLGLTYEISKFEDENFQSLSEIKVGNKVFWFTNAYGSAELSEYLHLACLFGSKKNIHLGCCGGLTANGSSRDLIIPDWSFAEESSAKAYQTESSNEHKSDKDLSNKLANELSAKYLIHRGPTITHQAMLAETWDDIQNWSKQGYIGVEMEAATVFAVSNHFNVPSAAVMFISDNLIKEETVLDDKFDNERDLRRLVSQDLFDAAVKEVLSE